jgi:hypothetical protein
MAKPPKDYDVGYGRPPKRGQFKRGQSGNPSGRRKRTKLFSERVLEALNEKVTITENGRKRTITKCEALAKQVANKGAGGDLKSIKFLFEILDGVDELERVARSEATHHQNSSSQDRIIRKLDQMRQRMDMRGQLLAKD